MQGSVEPRFAVGLLLPVPRILLVCENGVCWIAWGGSDCSKWVFDPGAARIARSGFLTRERLGLLEVGF